MELTPPRQVFTNSLGPLLVARLMTPVNLSTLLFDLSPDGWCGGRRVAFSLLERRNSSVLAIQRGPLVGAACFDGVRARTPVADALIASRCAPPDSWTRRTWAELGR